MERESDTITYSDRMTEENRQKGKTIMMEERLDIERENELMVRFGLTRLCARVVACRDCSDDQVAALLAEATMADPWEAEEMAQVVERLRQARNDQEKVLVCGDYDADGICATAIMVDALHRFGLTVGFYIPDRLSEGYGLNEKTVRMAKERAYSLLITVDNGVRAFAPLQTARQLGLDVIVTDHHVMDAQEPIVCNCLLHPQRMGEAFRTLSGAGVALEVSRALGTVNERQIVYAGVAAIGDVMEMKGETHSIVRQCIALLNQQRVRSIQLLANDSSVWDETKIAFQIVPKLNVTGRLSDRCNVNNTVRYLLSENGSDLITVSKQIAVLNETRKAMSTQMIQTAQRRLSSQSAFLIVSDPSFHEGIVGLVAGKLCEQYGRPCMVLAQKGDRLRGSIRSVEGVDLSHFFDDLDCLKEYGGHALAAGIAFDCRDRGEVERYVEKKMQLLLPLPLVQTRYIPIERELLTLEQVDSLRLLRPFGNGFEEPLFCVQDLTIADTRTLSGEQHMKWTEKNGMELLFFHVGDRMQDLKEGGFRHFGGTLGINQFRHQRKVSMILREVER